MVGWVFSLVLAGANVAALVWLVLGLRASGASRGRALAKRCALTLGATLGATVVMTAILGATAFLGFRGAGPEARATALARGISEMMSCAAAGVVLSLLPAVSWIVLALRWRRAT